MNVDFITCIDDIVMESQINVYNSFYDYYHKMYMLTEYSNDVFTEYYSVFQDITSPVNDIFIGEPSGSSLLAYIPILPLLLLLYIAI